MFSLVNASFQVCSIRILSYYFPLQMMFAISLVSCLSILSSGIGAISSKYFVGRPRAITILPGISILVSLTLVSLLQFFNLPDLSFVPLSIVLLAVPFFFMGVAFGTIYRSAQSVDRSSVKWIVSLSAVFFFAGYAATTYSISHTGVWNVVFIISAFLLLLGPRIAFFLVLSGVALLAILFASPGQHVFSLLEKEPIFWDPGASPPKHLRGIWSPYSRLDFFEDPNHGLAGLYNGYQFWRATDTNEPDAEVRVGLYNRLEGDVLVIGSGGGQGLLSLENAKTITAVELDPEVVSSMQGPLSKYNRGIYNTIEAAIASDGRAFVESSKKKYDAIIYEAAEFSISNSPRSFLNMENYLYTVEGIQTSIDRLKPDGVLFVIHTFKMIPTYKFLKAFPGDVSWRVWESTTDKVFPGFRFVIAFASRSEKSIQKLESFFNSVAFRVKDNTAFFKNNETFENESPVFDDRPLLHLRSTKQIYPFVFVSIFLLVVVIALVARRKERALPIFFSLIGIAFIVVELFIIYRFRSFFGGYVITSAITLGILSLSFALGSIYSPKIANKYLLPGVIATFAVLFLGTSILDFSYGQFVKVAWSVATISPIGFLMGVYFPKGALSAAPADTPFFYGLDTIGTALGFLLFYCLILIGGFTAALAFGLLLYIVASIILIRSI